MLLDGAILLMTCFTLLLPIHCRGEPQLINFTDPAFPQPIGSSLTFLATVCCVEQEYSLQPIWRIFSGSVQVFRFELIYPSGSSTPTNISEISDTLTDTIPVVTASISPNSNGHVETSLVINNVPKTYDDWRLRFHFRGTDYLETVTLDIGVCSEDITSSVSVASSSLASGATGYFYCIDSSRELYYTNGSLASNTTTCLANEQWERQDLIGCSSAPNVNLSVPLKITYDTPVTISCEWSGGFPPPTKYRVGFTDQIIAERTIGEDQSSASIDWTLDAEDNGRSLSCVVFNELAMNQKGESFALLNVEFLPYLHPDNETVSCENTTNTAQRCCIIFLANPLPSEVSLFEGLINDDTVEDQAEITDNVQWSTFESETTVCFDRSVMKSPTNYTLRISTSSFADAYLEILTSSTNTANPTITPTTTPFTNPPSNVVSTSDPPTDTTSATGIPPEIPSSAPVHIIVPVVVVLLALLVGILGFWFWRRRRNGEEKLRNPSSPIVQIAPARSNADSDYQYDNDEVFDSTDPLPFLPDNVVRPKLPGYTRYEKYEVGNSADNKTLPSGVVTDGAADEDKDVGEYEKIGYGIATDGYELPVTDTSTNDNIVNPKTVTEHATPHRSVLEPSYVPADDEFSDFSDDGAIPDNPADDEEVVYMEIE